MYNVVYNVVHSLSCFFDHVNTEGNAAPTRAASISASPMPVYALVGNGKSGGESLRPSPGIFASRGRSPLGGF
jgi:hypothetical protein